MIARVSVAKPGNQKPKQNIYSRAELIHTLYIAVIPPSRWSMTAQKKAPDPTCSGWTMTVLP